MQRSSAGPVLAPVADPPFSPNARARLESPGGPACRRTSVMPSAGLPVISIGAPINTAGWLIGFPITCHCTAQNLRKGVLRDDALYAIKRSEHLARQQGGPPQGPSLGLKTKP